MKAIQITAKGTSAITDKDIPELRDGSLLVRVVCVALNPCDAKNLYDAGPAETLLGTDYSGVVEKTGQGYRKQWKVGDRIFGFVMGANAAHPTDGAFAEYVLVKADVQYRIPDHMSFEQAASLGVSLSTAAMGICHKLHMPIVLDEDPEDGDGAAQNVFIYGGSTATGTMSIQLARIAGYLPYTTCSPSNFDLAMSFGAEAAFDYHDPHCATKVSGAAGSRFSRAFDTISSNQSAQMCAHVLKEGSDAAYTSTLPLTDRFPSRKVIPKLLLLWSALGEPVHFMGHYMPAVPEDFSFLREFTETAEILLQDGDIRPHPVRVVQGGLECIVAGLQELYDGRVSGEKLVYNIAAA